jgi:hypothetical protein
VADYRGGQRAQSGYGQELVKAIREGRTERQRKRNFEQKLIFGAVQAGLTGLGGAVSASHSKSEAAKRLAIENAKHAKWGEVTKETREMTPQVQGEGMGDVLKQKANEAVALQKLSDARSQATVNGEHAPGTINESADTVQMQARDLQRGIDGMREGRGMMGSLPDQTTEPGIPSYRQNRGMR